ncbi:hypothetical protein GJ496_002515 [Pomphorhynchus laevis]|nr:hypothetical protein GJ496_002515 [Pomphorhynchus laevis]
MGRTIFGEDQNLKVTCAIVGYLCHTFNRIQFTQKWANVSNWEIFLQSVLNSLRFLTCSSTNCTYHERIFTYTLKYRHIDSAKWIRPNTQNEQSNCSSNAPPIDRHENPTDMPDHASTKMPIIMTELVSDSQSTEHIRFLFESLKKRQSYFKDYVTEDKYLEYSQMKRL